MNENVIKMAEVIRRARQELGSGLILPEETATALHKAGYRKERETITFYKDPNIKDWAESEYAWCERPCDSTRSMRAIDKKGSIVGYASEHYWTWCDVKEVKKVSAIEFMRHFASKQSETVNEFAEKLKVKLTNPSGWVLYKCQDLCYDIDKIAAEFGVEVEKI